MLKALRLPTSMTLTSYRKMRRTDIAWNEVDMTTITNCWKKAGIPRDAFPAPSRPPTLTYRRENELNQALDQLQYTGVLYQKNRMNIEFLLKSPEENLNIDLATFSSGTRPQAVSRLKPAG
jgi:hypothetical protein